MTTTATRESPTDPKTPDICTEARQGSKPAQIILAAKELFTSQGFGTTSMDAIARTANVSKATLYAHFSGKEELFAAMVSNECRAQSGLLLAPGADDRELAGAVREIGRN